MKLCTIAPLASLCSFEAMHSTIDIRIATIIIIMVTVCHLVKPLSFILTTSVSLYYSITTVWYIANSVSLFRVSVFHV